MVADIMRYMALDNIRCDVMVEAITLMACRTELSGDTTQQFSEYTYAHITIQLHFLCLNDLVNRTGPTGLYKIWKKIAGILHMYLVYLLFVFLRTLALCGCAPYKEIDRWITHVSVPQVLLDSAPVYYTSLMKSASESLALLFTSACHKNWFRHIFLYSFEWNM